MPKITKIEQVPVTEFKRLRVAAYCRVSKSTERLLHSVSAQISYYSRLIQSNPKWEYAGVYSDWGISGTDIQKRAEFQRMMKDCEAGKINMIITKSISRFARNTVDLLNTVRYLKSLEIAVFFEEQNINSLSGDGEFMLTLLAAFAENESRSISENVKWGIRKRCQDGTIGVKNKHLLGYQYDEEQKKYIIIPEEADAVREMFRMYIEQIPLKKIQIALEKQGINFTFTGINNMLQNEVYCGHRLLQKCYVTDPIHKKKVRNNGILPKYLIQNTHEPIIDEQTFQLASDERKRRAALINPTYCFTGKIVCGICGHAFTRKFSPKGGHEYVYWICRAKKEKGITCKSVNFKENTLKEICTEVLQMDSFCEEQFCEKVRQMAVEKDGSITFYLFGGEVRIWKKES